MSYRAHSWESEDDLQESVLSSSHVGASIELRPSGLVGDAFNSWAILPDNTVLQLYRRKQPETLWISVALSGEIAHLVGEPSTWLPLGHPGRAVDLLEAQTLHQLLITILGGCMFCNSYIQPIKHFSLDFPNNGY